MSVTFDSELKIASLNFLQNLIQCAQPMPVVKALDESLSLTMQKDDKEVTPNFPHKQPDSPRPPNREDKVRQFLS